VDIQINNQVINNVKMKLGDNGVAFFVEEIKDDEELPDYLITSPLPSPSPSNEPKKKVSMIVVEREKKNKKEKDGPSHTHK
jgi:phosphatidate phosphatase PAH1